MTSAEAQDLILRHCLKNPKKTLSAQELKNEVLTDLKLAIINELVEQIDLMSNGKIAHVIKSERFHFIASNDLTEIFLEQGGFTKHEQDEADKRRKNEEREQLELNLAKSNLEANELNKRIAERNRKNERSNKIATWINVAIGLINLAVIAWQLYKAG